MEMVIQGVSTRKVSEITKQLCGTTFSKSTVSALCSRLDEQVMSLNRQPLTQKYAFVYADAMLFKVHQGNVVVSHSLLVTIGDSDSWMAFFDDLKQYDLDDVDLFVSDVHCDLKDAINAKFQNSLWQRCQFYLIQDCTGVLSYKERKEVANKLKDLFNAPTYKQAT